MEDREVLSKILMEVRGLKEEHRQFYRIFKSDMIFLMEQLHHVEQYQDEIASLKDKLYKLEEVIYQQHNMWH